MNLETYFRILGAPLANTRWSWGAVRDGDGAVILRAWQDYMVKDSCGWRILVSKKHKGTGSKQGLAERKRHLELLDAGAPGYSIICRAEDINAKVRKIKSFSRDLWEITTIVDIDDQLWAYLIKVM